MNLKIAVVTGANKGLGLEVCRQLALKGYAVVMTARSKSRGGEALKILSSEGLTNIIFHSLDVTSVHSCRELANFLDEKYGVVDLLVNNAGIMLDYPIQGIEVDPNLVRKTLEVNTLGVLHLTQKLIPLLRKSKDGRIINVSSGLGAISEMLGGGTGYRLSKTSLNALTKIWAYELAGDKIKVNSVCPGWCVTDMGGKDADRTPAQGAESILWLADASDEISGEFFRDGKKIPW